MSDFYKCPKCGNEVSIYRDDCPACLSSLEAASEAKPRSGSASSEGCRGARAPKTPDDVSASVVGTESDSAALKERIAQLEKECGIYCDELVFRGQHVAAVQMSDAVSGLHKTLSCWNKAIEWNEAEAADAPPSGERARPDNNDSPDMNQ